MKLSEWFGQVGGMMAMLIRVIFFVFSLLQFDSLSQVLVRKLYFVQPKVPMGINQSKVSDQEAQAAFKAR